MPDMRLPALKRYGQNFLVDPNIKRKIISAVGIRPKDTILEIGPGQGSLTFDLAAACGRLIALEIDKGLCRHLSLQIEEFPHLTLLCQNVLKFDLKKYFKKEKIARARVVSNLPYYISTPVLEYLFERSEFFEDIFLTLQKEVALRMVSKACEANYGSLSCFVRYYCEPEILFKIPAGCFRPRPKVDSVFVRLIVRKDPVSYWKVQSEEFLFCVIRTAFGQRRKMLKSGLRDLLEKKPSAVKEAGDLLECRPEEISLEEYVRLSNILACVSKNKNKRLV